MTPPTVISLFSGAGGLDLGFKHAGYVLRWAVESDPVAARTYARNLGSHVEVGELPALSPPASLSGDVVIAGPPCQGFSVHGKLDPDDPRNSLLYLPLALAEAHGAEAVVIENVAALARNSRWAAARQRLMDESLRHGYRGAIHVLNAADYGVPQSRMRMFFIGFRDGRMAARFAPAPAGIRTVRQAFAKLPSLGEPGNNTLCGARVVPAPRPILRSNAYGGGLLFNGSGRVLRLDAPARTLPASMGGNATPIVDQLELEAGASAWVEEYHRRLVAGGQPATTAPPRMRRITVEEAAALQSFPRRFEFCGGRNAKYRQIGNAVPPELARVVAEAVAQALGATPAHGAAPSPSRARRRAAA